MLSLAGLAAAAGEWLRAPSRGLALAALALALLTIALKRRGYLLVPLALVAITLAAGQGRLERLAGRWPEERESRIQSASARLSDELRDARLLADSLARQALRCGPASFEAGLRAWPRSVRVPSRSGIVVFEPSAEPRIWSGRFRLLPSAAGDSVDVRLTSFYAVLEVRAMTPRAGPRWGSAASRHPRVPDRERSLAAQFQHRPKWAYGPRGR